MTDTNTTAVLANPVVSGDEKLIDSELQRLTSVVELIFFAYRDFTGESDAALKQLNFGRAHHRVLHFVTWRPGLRVADLLDILKITKQSLARVLKQLIDRGFVVQEAGEADRRERRLYPSLDGRKLADQLRALQTKRIARALNEIEPQAQGGALRFLLALTAPADRISLEQALRSAGMNVSDEALPAQRREAKSTVKVG